MKRDPSGIRLSASDLMRFMSCRHATRLDLDRLNGVGPEPAEDSEDAELLQRHGDEHEAAHLAQLEASGLTVTRIETEGIPFENAVKATREAIKRGTDIVFQGALEGGMWGGYSDFLERVPVPSALGDFSYEVADTKLKRKPAPGHVLQLVLYSDLVAAIQGHAPEEAHVILGTGERFSFRLSEYAHYARGARARLEDFVASPSPTRPIPCSACDLCRWRVHCSTVWKGTDSLHLVAGLTRGQAAKLEAAGITTMEDLAQHEGRVPKMAQATLDKLRVQARLQHKRKTSQAPFWLLRPYEPCKGFDLLPRPAKGDLFYDIEGDPHYREGSAEGLEYLHGVWNGERFTGLWAHSLEAEKAALEALFDLFEAQIATYPDARIYHYAAYEITALRKLTMRHGVGERQLDRWLRERRFVDLYTVVRGAVYASEPSYSIKDMEAFYDLPRTGEVTTSGGSVVAYEKWRQSGEDQILIDLEEYNRVDCISTEKLRDWLVSIRPDGGNWLELGEGSTTASEEIETEAADLKALIDATDLPEDRKRLLHDLAVFHWREAKPAAWNVFDAASKDADELFDDMECLGGLQATGPVRPVKKSAERDYRYPPQETKLRVGKQAQIALGEDFAGVTITALDRGRRSVTIKLGPKYGQQFPDRIDLLPNFALRAKPIPEAIRRVVEDQCGDRLNRAAEDLLSRSPPRFTGPAPLPLNESEDPIKGLIASVKAMDGTILPVQGPPGTGKTYVTARAILSLVQDGKRIAVASNSHEAIRNVLKGCIDALNDGDDPDITLSLADVALAHKIGQSTEDPPSGYDAIQSVTSNDDVRLSTADIVGGTAWLFAREDQAGAFDYLFADEAGQVSLANLVAMSNATRNIVLVGDPRQLPQVIQGAHPHPANLSCLDWMLGQDHNVDPYRGIFLPETRRMHPALCSYISEQFYGGRLHPHGSTGSQVIDAKGLPSAGAYLVAVDHDGRAQESSEEAAEIEQAIRRLLEGSWTDRDGVTRPLQQSDIIVVAPYNAQVNALAERLPGIRVGTVDKFQGQEAPVALISMTSSSAEETSRGLDFLLSRERLNVAVSRGKALSLVFASPRLLETPCATVEQMRLVNALCALPSFPQDGPND
ncbi:TM0106 family RecB-like putative nuclease [Ruegeria pomeroyi]|nr:TM0106 family RecB-like putative nuclease [Ruegeria pomeroyi]